MMHLTMRLMTLEMTMVVGLPIAKVEPPVVVADGHEEDHEDGHRDDHKDRPMREEVS